MPMPRELTGCIHGNRIGSGCAECAGETDEVEVGAEHSGNAEMMEVAVAKKKTKKSKPTVAVKAPAASKPKGRRSSDFNAAADEMRRRAKKRTERPREFDQLTFPGVEVKHVAR